MTGGQTRSRAAREIASAVIGLIRKASVFIDVEAPTIADLHAEPTAVETQLYRLVSMIRTGSVRCEFDAISEETQVVIAVEALALMQEWRQFQHRDITYRRGELHHSLLRLGALRTDEELFDQVCQEACRAIGAGRSLLARIDAGCWIPWRQFDTTTPRTNTSTLPDAHAQPVRTLAVESAVVTSRLPTWVAGGPHQAQPGPVRKLVHRRPFSITPIVVNDDVIGLLYATDPPAARWGPPDVAGYLQTFVATVGHLVERAVMFAHVDAQSRFLREALSAAELTIAGFDHDVDLVQLVGRQQAGPTPAGAAPWTTPRYRLDQDFTGRERDVMALLAQGMNNSQIAQQLAVATSTVKSHLQNMLRKAGAVNRADLIAQYYGQTRLTT
jgi:DNA-binding CsgD family transcriptional regulator